MLIIIYKSKCFKQNGVFQVTASKMQRFLINLFISKDALHVSGGSSAHHQEHTTVQTASGIINQYCC